MKVVAFIRKAFQRAREAITDIPAAAVEPERPDGRTWTHEDEHSPDMWSPDVLDGPDGWTWRTYDGWTRTHKGTREDMRKYERSPDVLDGPDDWPWRTYDGLIWTHKDTLEDIHEDERTKLP